MRNAKTTLALAGAALAALVLGGCSGPTEAPKDTVVVAGQFATESLDPHGVDGGGIGTAHAAQSIFSRLLAPDAEGVFHADLATEWETNESGSEWTFTLRDNAEFSDGTPVTAADVAASLDRILALEGPLAGNFGGVTASVVDDTTVAFSSEKPILAGTLALIFVTKADVTDASFSEPIGSGPYVVTSFSPGESLKLAPNETYYGDVPTISQLEYRWIPEVSTRLTALQTGEIDATWGIPDDQAAALRSNPDLVVESSPSTLVVTMWFNSSRPAFATSEIRNALWSAVDFETIVSTLFPESGALSDSVLAPSVFGYSPQEPKTYDPEAARAALEEAGFDFEQEIQIQYKESEYTEFMAAIASDLAEIGVKAVPVQKEAAVFLEDLLALNWDINFQMVGTATYDAAQNLGRLYTCAADRNGYCNPELDEILAEAGSTTDVDTRLDLYDQANRIIWDDAVGMFPMVINTTYAWQAGLQGFAPDPLTKPDLSHVSFGD